ncbi:MAG TPA: CAP domain-containing protein [Chloroflexi bacterium]|nr:CAP domain-containing protein [Chloroflexota bacterium]
MIADRTPHGVIALLLIVLCVTVTPQVHGSGDTIVRLPIVVSEPLPTPTPDPIAGVEARIGALINEARAAEGLPPLAVSPELAQAARRHSADMAAHVQCGHIGSDGSTPGDRIEATGYSWYACGENVAAGYRTPEDVVAAWMGSDGHRAAILSEVYQEMGVGYARTSHGYYHYYTVDFACRSGR